MNRGNFWQIIRIRSLVDWRPGTLMKLVGFNRHGYWMVETIGEQFTVNAIGSFWKSRGQASRSILPAGFFTPSCATFSTLNCINYLNTGELRNGFEVD